MRIPEHVVTNLLYEAVTEPAESVIWLDLYKAASNLGRKFAPSLAAGESSYLFARETGHRTSLPLNTVWQQP